ncbi:hypothetical protein HOF65_04445 [bacterium]|nr:hypothetical protein [bacterium]
MDLFLSLVAWACCISSGVAHIKSVALLINVLVHIGAIVLNTAEPKEAPGLLISLGLCCSSITLFCLTCIAIIYCYKEGKSSCSLSYHASSLKKPFLSHSLSNIQASFNISSISSSE